MRRHAPTARKGVSTTTEVDVLIVSDLRLPGGTMASIAEEVRAQAAPGHRTGLIHVNSRLSRKRDLGIDARLGRCIDEGMATLVLRGNVFARLAVLRNGTVFERKA
jgi:hypothetical protein